MKDYKRMRQMLKDSVQYVMVPQARYAQGIGLYVSYDIVAYDSTKRDIIAIAPDVTADRNSALRIVGQFNRYQLSPIHLEEAIEDALN